MPVATNFIEGYFAQVFRRLDWYTSCSSPRLVWEKSSEKEPYTESLCTPRVDQCITTSLCTHQKALSQSAHNATIVTLLFGWKVTFVSRGKIILVLSSSFWDLGQHSLPKFHQPGKRKCFHTSWVHCEDTQQNKPSYTKYKHTQWQYANIQSGIQHECVLWD